MSCKTISTLVGIACLLFVRVAAFRLTMSPDYVQVSTALQSVTFTCNADLALIGCQFRWWDESGKAGPLMDLSWGSQSLTLYNELGTGVTNYIYSGRGLRQGDCGVSLQVNGNKRYMVACRVRAESGGWTYAWVDFYADNYELFPHTLTPREAVVLPGGAARVALKAQEPVLNCLFFSSSLGRLDLLKGAKSTQSTGRHLYLGAGVEAGECGLALTNVSEADNGPIRIWMWNGATKNINRYMALIVARPPSAPTMSVVYADAGVTATCVVPEARPVAKIIWFFADVVVRQDSIDDSPSNPQDEWRWPWMQGSVLQRLTLGLQPKDSGKVLKCVVSHVALVRPLEATEIISFAGPARETVLLAVTSTTPGAGPNTTQGPSTTLNPTCTATSILGLVCQEYRGLENTSCPRDEVYEFRVREAGAAARTAELAEEQAKVTLEAAKVTLEAAIAEAASNATLAKLSEEQAKVTLEAAKFSAKAEEETKATLAKLAEEQAKVNLGATKSRAKAEEARARGEEAWAKNAEAELEFEQRRRD